MSAPTPIINGPVSSRDTARWPEAWCQGTTDAWAAFESLPLPLRKDEDWRFSSISAVRIDDYLLGVSAPVDPDLPAFPVKGAARARFINGSQISFDSLPDELRAKGVIWTSLAEAVKRHPDVIDRAFMKHEEALGSRKFAHLHRAFVEIGTVLVVPKGVRIEQPLVAEYWLHGDHASIFPHTLILAGEGSEVTFIDSYRSTGDLPGLACAVNDIRAEAGSKVSYLCAQEWNEQTLSFQIGASYTARDAESKAFHFNTGARFARLETIGHLEGPGARGEMLGLSLLHDHQEFDQRTLQLHNAPHTWSDLLFKNSLDHRSKAIFSGLIKVASGAKQTDAYQTNRNLLLDPNAEADSMPGLEICNDDVKCSHGATTSQIDEEPLFYMNARGIGSHAAKHLIAVGFCGEVLDRFDNEEVSAALKTIIEAKYMRSAKLGHVADALDDSDRADAVARETNNVRELQGTL